MITKKHKELLMRLCPGYDNQAGAMEEALQALLAVRVLDTFAEKHNLPTPTPRPTEDGYEVTLPQPRGHDPVLVAGQSRDAARSAAAHAALTEDPGLGENL